MEGPKYREGVVLLAHGSAGPEADAEAKALSGLLSDRGGWPVVPAFLNREASLSQAIAELRFRGCEAILVAPLLVFGGKHVREDLPALVETERRAHPDLRIDCVPHLSRLPGFEEWLLQALRSGARMRDSA